MPTIATYGREELRAFFTGFLEIVQGILRLEAPSICAVHGPAIAGGFILSLACDLRVVGPGARKLGLSEVDLAIAVPAGTQVLLAARTNLQTSLNLAMSAHTIGPEEARAVGYADELADNPVARALEIARSLAEKPGRGAAVTRLFPGLALADRALEADRAHLERFLDTWMSPEAQRRLQALAAHLTRK